MDHKEALDGLVSHLELLRSQLAESEAARQKVLRECEATKRRVGQKEEALEGWHERIAVLVTDKERLRFEVGEQRRLLKEARERTREVMSASREMEVAFEMERHRFISVVHEANKELGETLGVIIGPILNLPIQHGPSLESPHPEESGNPDV